MDNGASNHTTRYKYYLIDFIEKESHQKVKLGDNYQYPIKGVGEASYKLEYGKQLKMKDVLYVPGLKKSLLSISGLEKDGFRIAFVNWQDLMWPKGDTIDDTIVIGVEEGGLYKLKGKLDQALVNSTINLSELWHRIFAHLHYRALPILSKVVTSLPKIQMNHDGV